MSDSQPFSALRALFENATARIAALCAAGLIGSLMLCQPAFATCTVTNSFSNGTTADATQVNQNFTDVTGCVNSIGSPGQLAGTTTNDNASTGNIGEYHSCDALSSAPISLTSNTATNVCSVSVGAGDWQACGAVGFSGAPSGTTYTIGAINTTSATMPTEGIEAAYMNNSSTRGRYSTGCTRFSLAATATIYLIALEVFTGGYDGAVGELEVRRAR